MSRQVIEDTIHQHLRHHLPSSLRLGKKSLFCGFSHSRVSASFHHFVQRFKIKRLGGSVGQRGVLRGV